MKYSVRPYIYNTEEKYTTFLSEIHQLSFSELNDIIENLYGVRNGSHETSDWKGTVSSLDMRKEISHLSYRNVFMADIPTIELYNMLKAYRDKWLEYENKEEV